MSNIILHRIQPKVEGYLSHSQAAYRPNRCTSDIVWSHRFLSARIQKYREEFFITGIDMSAAFDTIKRKELLDILKTFLDEDETRMIQYLLSNTSLEVKVPSNVETTSFTTNIGSPQGDALSGCLFTIYFESSLRKFRIQINNNPILNEHSYALPYDPTYPEECIYADDADFISKSEPRRLQITNNAKESLAKDNLLVNETKTEHTVLKRDSKENEHWRHTKKLGSLLGDKEDITRRKQLAISAMRKLKKVWIRHHKISRSVRLKLYNAYVKSVLLYNCGTWGLTKSDEDGLDSFHRRQLREVLNIKYPVIVKSVELYVITSEQHISLQILNHRWRLFGHILRLNSQTPARKAMSQYFTESTVPKFPGRQRITLPLTIDRDICRAVVSNTITFDDILSFKSNDDLQKLINIAQDRNSWKQLTKEIFLAAQAEKIQN